MHVHYLRRLCIYLAIKGLVNAAVWLIYNPLASYGLVDGVGKTMTRKFVDMYFSDIFIFQRGFLGVFKAYI